MSQDYDDAEAREQQATENDERSAGVSEDFDKTIFRLKVMKEASRMLEALEWIEREATDGDSPEHTVRAVRAVAALAVGRVRSGR